MEVYSLFLGNLIGPSFFFNFAVEDLVYQNLSLWTKGHVPSHIPDCPIILCERAWGQAGTNHNLKFV